jgi:hypothetical protein
VGGVSTAEQADEAQELERERAVNLAGALRVLARVSALPVSL